jgi:methionyl-tRNA formyltransferase
LIRELHPLIVEARAPRFPQDLSKGSYFGRRSPDDGRISWSWPARRIFNLVRAVTHPYPGAFCFVSGRKMFIWEARVGREAGTCVRPGEIIGRTAEGVEVAAGEGTVIVVRAQLDGRAEGAANSVFSSAVPATAILD